MHNVLLVRSLSGAFTCASYAIYKSGVADDALPLDIA